MPGPGHILLSYYQRGLIYFVAFGSVISMISSEQIDALRRTALLAGGIIALSNTLFNLPLEWLNNWWPIAPILLGGYLIYRARQEQKTDQGE